MKYLLVVGFACDVYRQEPRARIFVDNKLIDEFNIQHHESNFQKKKNSQVFFSRQASITTIFLY